MQIRSVGIDLGKTTFHVVALNAAEQGAVAGRSSPRSSSSRSTANMQTSLIGDGRRVPGRTSSDVKLREQGHDVKLIPAQFVKPFVKSNKNDFLDAEAIAEAQ